MDLSNLSNLNRANYKLDLMNWHEHSINAVNRNEIFYPSFYDLIIR